MTGVETKLLVASLLAGFGIAAPWPNFVGGMFLALACAVLMMIFTEPSSRKTYWIVLFSAALFGILGAIIHATIVPAWSLHLVMAFAGGMSVYLVEGAKSFGTALRDQLAKLPGDIIHRIFGTGGK
ncbi:MAG: hypothetical protein R3E21_07865 [Caenibius sp.]